MAEFPFDKLLAPISEEQPCGVDLEMEGDAEYLNFSARIEGVLPASYFDFDRGAIDFPAEIATIASISKKSVDLRVLVPLAKLLILNRDFRGFQQCATVLAALVAQRWEHVHPQPFDGDSFLRAVTLQTLDDMPHTVFPLQAAPLFKTRRFGAVSYRQYLLAEGSLPPRRTHDGEGEEKAPSLSDLRGAVAEADLAELVAARDVAALLLAAVQALEGGYDEASGQPGVLRLPRLREMTQGMLHFLEASVVGRDPALATLAAAATGDGGDGPDEAGGDAGPAAAAPGAVASLRDAAAALGVAAAYFGRREPSSTARLWLAQAQSLIGKNFYEALRALTPDYSSNATLRLGAGLPLTLPVERLSDLLDQFPTPEEEEPEPQQEPASEGGGDGEGQGDGEQESGEDAAGGPRGGAAAAPASFAARNRLEALQLMQAATDYFRASEPSSPIPLLLDQARAGAGRDFIALLRETLPPQALQRDD